MLPMADNSIQDAGLSTPDPAEALLLKRELAGLTALTLVRGIVIAVLFFMTLAIGFSGFENVAVGIVTLIYALALTL